MTRTALSLAALVAAAIALPACGDGASDDQPRAATPVASADRYCSLVHELDAAGEEVFGGLGRNATPEQYEAAEREFVRRFASKLSAIQSAAPGEISADVRTLLAAQRKRGGLDPGQPVTQRDATAAEKRLQAYERHQCAR